MSSSDVKEKKKRSKKKVDWMANPKQLFYSLFTFTLFVYVCWNLILDLISNVYLKIYIFIFFVCFVLFCGIHVYRDLKGYQIKCISSFKCIEAVMKYLYLSWVFFSFFFCSVCCFFFKRISFQSIAEWIDGKIINVSLFFFVWFCTRFKLNIKIFCVFFFMFEQILNWQI